MGTAVSTSSDYDLWKRSGDGDPLAFAELFDRYADTVYAVCFRRTGSWADAEELTSITFLEAWRARGKAHLQHGSLLPWILGLAMNVARNQARAARRYRGLISRLPRPEDMPDIADAAAARLDAEVAMRAVLAELNRLPGGDRDVAVLCLWQGLTYAETAVALNIPIGTVRSRLSRCRSHLSETARQAQIGNPPRKEPE